jgi:hypothetical protein
MRTRPALAAVLLALVTTTTACIGMPEAGPVVPADNAVQNPPAVGVERVAQLPQEGDSPQAIVSGFLQAMTAYPVNLPVVRQFLTTDEQDAWDPSRRTLTYESPYSPTGAGTAVTVRLEDAQWVDGRGTWRGERGNGRPRLHFTLTEENDEWRIASAPNAFIIPSDWFQDHYTQKLLYYFDPTASILVPEPVFVSADQLTSSLVKALLDGPGPPLAEVVRTFVPQGLTPGLSVPVDGNGVATVALEGDPTRLTPETAKLLVYQFAWTLNQVPELTAFRVTIGGEPVTMPGGSSNQFSVDLGSEYDPTDVQASNQLFAVDSGSLETGDPTSLQAVTGPLGTFGGIDSVGVDLDAKQAAAVTDGGTRLVVAPLTSVGAEQAPSTTVLSGATKLLRPAWDFQRLWVVDRTADGARVSVLDPDQGLVPTPVTIDGITGRRVRDFIVSRDGTRFVAVVQGRDGDQLRISRVRQTFGRVVGATPSRNLAWSSGDAERIRDIGWRSPTTVGVLHALTRQFTQFASVSVDGAGGPQLQEQTVLQNVATHVVSSPAENEPWYAIDGDQLIDPDNEAVTLPSTVSSIQYVG